MKTLPASEISWDIHGNKYEIKFPKVGQYIDIESRKAILSSGQYKSLLTSYSPAVSYIDAIATITTLVPTLVKDLRVESLFDLELKDVVPLLEFYEKKYLPWHDEWMEYLKPEPVPTKEEKND